MAENIRFFVFFRLLLERTEEMELPDGEETFGLSVIIDVSGYRLRHVSHR